MRQRALLAVLTMLFTISGVAGCLQGADGGQSESGGVEVRDIHGWVTDDELVPVSGANVSLEELDRRTRSSDDGSFALSDVPLGLWTLSVERAGYTTETFTVNASQPDPQPLELRIFRLPSVEPHSVPFVFEGQYECTWEFLIVGGDCLGLYENFTGRPDPVTNDTYAFRLPVRPGWESISVEMTWRSDAANQFSGMRLFLEHGNSSVSGHGTKLARADGDDNPLALLLHRGEIHPGADYYRGTTTKAKLGDSGEETQIRVFPRGHATDITGQVCPEPGRCLMGLGAGVDVDFTVHAVVFYHARAPAGFSAIPT